MEEARTLLTVADEVHPSRHFSDLGCDEGDWLHRAHIQLLIAAVTEDGPTARRIWSGLAGLEPGPYRALVLEDTLLAIEAALRLQIPSGDIRAVVLEPLLSWWGRSEDGVALAEGLLASGEDDHQATIQLLSSGLDAEPVGLPRYLAGSLRLTLARAHLAAGHPEVVRPLAEAAVADLARWPGRRHDEATALARRARISPAPTPGTSSAAGGATARDAPGATVGAEAANELTPREREVAALVALGLSNGELARRLFISPKTASVHVSNILAKLGMTRRAEIAAWAVRHRIGGVSGAAESLPAVSDDARRRAR
jgi:DNA-binding CsgD family transcriptional regulator